MKFKRYSIIHSDSGLNKYAYLIIDCDNNDYQLIRLFIISGHIQNLIRPTEFIDNNYILITDVFCDQL